MWEVIFEISRVLGAISVPKCTLSFLGAVHPETLVDRTVGPLAQTFASHLAFNPFTLVFPTLSCTYEEAYALLEAIKVIALIEVPIFPFSDSSAIWEATFEFP